MNAATTCGADQLNRELARLLHTSPADLPATSDAASADDLVVCGLLGGKDVGKSTLINALVGQPITQDTQEIGPGTQTPLAYVAQAAVPTIRHRMHLAAPDLRCDLSAHNETSSQGTVLVDLPDFDSEFAAHATIVRQMAPLLDRVIWILTPRKIGDRAWCEMVPRVIKDLPNIYVVLNKVDELLADFGAATTTATAEQFWAEQRNWVRQIVNASGLPIPDDRVFLIAAAYPTATRLVQRVGYMWDDESWTRYATQREQVLRMAQSAEQDLQRLRDAVLPSMETRDVAQIKVGNRAAEQEKLTFAIEAHYTLDRMEAVLAQAADQNEWVDVAQPDLGPDYTAQVAGNLLACMKPESEVAAITLRRNIHRWPLLRLVYWPFGGIARSIGRRWIANRPTATQPTDPTCVAGIDLPSRVAGVRERYLLRHSAMLTKLGLVDQIATADTMTRRLQDAMLAIPELIEQRVISAMCRRKPIRDGLANMTLWLLLGWWMLAQPLLAGAINNDLPFRWDWNRAIRTTIGLLSAAHIAGTLASFFGVLLVVLAVIYVRTSRKVTRLLGAELAGAPASQAIDASDHLQSLVASAVHTIICTDLTAPAARRLDDLKLIRDRLRPGDSTSTRPVRTENQLRPLA